MPSKVQLTKAILFGGCCGILVAIACRILGVDKETASRVSGAVAGTISGAYLYSTKRGIPSVVPRWFAFASAMALGCAAPSVFPGLNKAVIAATVAGAVVAALSRDSCESGAGT